MRWGLQVAGLPNETIDEIDIASPAAARLLKRAKELEPIIEELLPLVEQAEPLIDQATPIIKAMMPDIKLAMPAAQDIADYLNRGRND